MSWASEVGPASSRVEEDVVIEFAAPGKAVVWGEYAVLEGAPAMVMAVDRYASTRIEPGSGGWHIAARGFQGDQILSAADLTGRAGTAGAAAVVRASLLALGITDLPPGAEVLTDTTAFHSDGQKLGIGSSAAICTATCAALAERFGRPFSFETALAAHRILQGRAGSGLDVAAACRGGLIRFESGESRAAQWPDGLCYRYVWSGSPAKTTDHLARFAAWRAGKDTAPLRALCDASERLFAEPGMGALEEYVAKLRAFDEAANLGIFVAAHRRLLELANRCQVVYKPCGAGGGDIGIALSRDACALDAFITSTARESFLILDLEIAAHGVHRIRS